MYLDFACGTGRIVAYMAARVSHAVGVDVSGSMLAEARDHAPSAEIHQADLTTQDMLEDRRFDLITAFRFFPNAEPALRAATMRVLVRHLAPGGLLVFNNHKQEGSLLLRMAAALGRRSTPEEAARRGDRMMTRAEVDALVRSAGLRMVSRHPLAVLPFTDRHMPGPGWLLEVLENRLAALPGSAALAQNVIYVCTAGATP
jgi:predicted TPR repeat methyltransferase